MTPPRVGPVDDFDGYQLFMLTLSIIALAVLAAITFVRVDADTLRILHWADVVVCIFFFADFVRSFVRASSKSRYFFTWGWIDLISSIPLLAGFRLGRAVRVVRIVQALRVARASRTLAMFLLARRARSGGLAAALLAFVAIFAGSISILQFERGHGGPIQSPVDALWWAITTLTTVGYGDMVPVTLGGKAVAGVLMVGGVALYGAVAGLVASWFITPAEREEEREIAELRGEIQALRRDLAGVRGAGPTVPEPPA